MALNEMNFVEQTGKSEFADRLLCLALDVGEGMLKSGGEVHRVEDTVIRICHAYGAAHVEIFAISSVVFAAIRMKNGEYSSQMRRVYSTGYHLHQLELYNDVSRTVCRKTPSLDEFNEMIVRVKKTKTYPAWICSLSAGLVAGSLALFFMGDLWDGLVAAVIGALIFTIDLLPSAHINRLAKTGVQSFVGGLLACFSMKLGIGHDMEAIMIGTIMVLIPGLSFGTAFRDLLCGDFLAGTLRTVQCILVALMIAAGYLLAMYFVGGIV